MDASGHLHGMRKRTPSSTAIRPGVRGGMVDLHRGVRGSPRRMNEDSLGRLRWNCHPQRPAAGLDAAARGGAGADTAAHERRRARVRRCGGARPGLRHAVSRGAAGQGASEAPSPTSAFPHQVIITIALRVASGADLLRPRPLAPSLNRLSSPRRWFALRHYACTTTDLKPPPSPKLPCYHRSTRARGPPQMHACQMQTLQFALGLADALAPQNAPERCPNAAKKNEDRCRHRHPHLGAAPPQEKPSRETASDSRIEKLLAARGGKKSARPPLDAPPLATRKCSYYHYDDDYRPNCPTQYLVLGWAAPVAAHTGHDGDGGGDDDDGGDDDGDGGDDDDDGADGLVAGNGNSPATGGLPAADLQRLTMASRLSHYLPQSTSFRQPRLRLSRYGCAGAASANGPLAALENIGLDCKFHGHMRTRECRREPGAVRGPAATAVTTTATRCLDDCGFTNGGDEVGWDSRPASCTARLFC